MQRPHLELASFVKTAAVVFALGLVLSPTAAFSARLRIPIFRSSPTPVRALPAQPRVGVSVVPTPRTASATTTGASPGPSSVGLSSAGDSADRAGVRTASVAPPLKRTAAEEQAAHRKAWFEFCQPKLQPPDRYGVERYAYAHPGCQFGRTD